jgi:hypothetical protein
MAQGYPIWSGAFWNLNERERREKKIEEEVLMRELTKLAAEAGYRKEEAEMRETGANMRAEKGETGAKERQAAELALREKLAQDAIQANVDSQGRDFLTRLGAIKTEYGAKGDLNEQDWKREEANRTKAQEIAERNSYAQYLQSLALYGRDNDIQPELLTLGKIPAGTSSVPTGTTLDRNGAATRPGRIKLNTSGTATPPTAKPGETPRTTDNAAPQVPVQVGPKPPTADVKLDSAGGIGTGLLENIRGNTWGIGPGSKNMQALVEAYLQKSNQAEPPSILDALGKELGYDQRRPSIKK